MRRKRILLVDDEKDALHALELMLQESGYAVYTAASAEEGLRYMRAIHPHLLMVDFKLPAMSGVDFLEIARAENPDVPALIVTGLTQRIEEVEASCKKLRIFELIRKPVETQRLRDTVRAALETRGGA